MSTKGNKNALKHGAYAKEILLPNESAEEFEQLHQAFRLQFNPDGGAEEAVVRQLAGTQWQKDRLDGWLCRAYELAEHVASEVGQSPFDIIVRLLKASNEQPNLFVLDQRAKVVRQLAELNPSHYNVDAILKLREQLDRSFDKGVQRLVSMKEFKRIYGAKPIEKLPKAESTSIAPVETDGDTAENAENSKTGKRHEGEN
jgi:hypothetical protein